MASQADCVASSPTSCATTVSMEEACVNAISCAVPVPAECPASPCQ
jgi:hypothetical protein